MRDIRIWLIPIAALFTALNVSLAMTIGALSAPPIYDDNGYLLDGYQRIAFDGVWSISALVSNFLDNPPHAPVETLSVMTGFWLFGPNNVGPYIVNFWALLAYSFIIFKIARDRINPGAAFALAVAAMFIPAASALVSELRPDMIAGLFFAFSSYLLIVRKTSERSATSAAAVGLLCAFTVLIKLSAVVITVPMLGFALVIGIGLHGSRWRSAIPPAFTMICAALTVLVPAAIIWGPQTYAYIYQALVSNKDVWHTPGSWLFHLKFSATGAGGGALALGPFFFFGLALIVADMIRCSLGQHRDLRALAYYAWTATIFLGIASAADKSVYQSSFFFFPFIVSSTMAFSRLVPTKEKPANAVSLAAMLATVVFLSPANTFQKGVYRKDTWGMLEQIAIQVHRGTWNMPACGGTFGYGYATIGSYPVTAEAVALEVAQEHNIRLQISHLFILRSIEEIMDKVNDSNFVLSPNDAGMTESLNQRLPGSKFDEEVKQRLRNDQRWSEVKIEAADPLSLFVRTRC